MHIQKLLNWFDIHHLNNYSLMVRYTTILNKLIIKSVFFKSTQSCIIFIVNLYFAKYETNTCRHEAKMFRNSYPHPKVNFDVFCIWPTLEIVKELWNITLNFFTLEMLLH